MAATAAERAKAYRARKAAAAGKAAAFTAVVECLWCGSTVGGKRPDAIFCSDACAKASNRKVKRTDYEGGSTAAVDAAEAKLAEALTTAWEVFGWGDGKAFTVEGWMSGNDPDEEWFWAKFVDGGGPVDANETGWLAVVKEVAEAVMVARRSAAGFKAYAAAVKRAAASVGQLGPRPSPLNKVRGANGADQLSTEQASRPGAPGWGSHRLTAEQTELNTVAGPNRPGGLTAEQATPGANGTSPLAAGAALAGPSSRLPIAWAAAAPPCAAC